MEKICILFSQETYNFAEKYGFTVKGCGTALLRSEDGVLALENPVSIVFERSWTTTTFVSELIVRMKNENPSLYISAMTTVEVDSKHQCLIINYEKK